MLPNSVPATVRAYANQADPIMTAPANSLEQALSQATMRLLRATTVSIADRTRAIEMIRDALSAGKSFAALPLAAALARHFPNDPQVSLIHGIALRLEQRLEDAEGVFTRAVAAEPNDPALAQGLAQTRFELGLPAAVLFARAHSAQPRNPDILRNLASAMAEEGEMTGAEALLEAELGRAPGWLAGHATLSALRWTRGNPAEFDASYAAATRAQVNNKELWLAWFGAAAQIRDWAKVTAILDGIEAQFGEIAPLLAGRLFLAVESGDDAAVDQLLNQTANLRGDATSLARVRHFLKRGYFREAEQICTEHAATSYSALFLPYLSLAWRMQGDERHIWLDRPEETIKALTVDLTSADYTELAEVLRSLHTMDRPYAEQSVRGGTQTDRSAILRHEPIIRKARAAWLAAIRDYVDGLPAIEEGHPLLGLPRGELMIEGSWSVRLQGQGYNVPHNHPAGWLSTAFYIALPEPAEFGDAPAGHIAFGTAPEELGLDLQPYRTIAPKVGTTAIFPSFMWHQTIPFKQGERLVLALDVRRPRR